MTSTRDIYCLTGLLKDKEVVSTYGLKIPTIRHWKNKTLDDYDSWKRLAYELLVRYVPEKDIHIKDDDVKNSKLEIKKNLTSLEIGEKDYGSFKTSPKEYKLFISKVVEHTPSEIFAQRIKFLRECIDSVDKKVINSIYNTQADLV